MCKQEIPGGVGSSTTLPSLGRGYCTRVSADVCMPKILMACVAKATEVTGYHGVGS